jgi:hypothetical protein
MRRPALALAWLSRWLLLKQTVHPEPDWLAWQLARRPAWRQQVSLLVLQLASPPLAWQRAWRWPVWQQRQV